MATYIKIKIRRDSTINWENVNPILDLGELGADMTKHGLKVGNGLDKWKDLPFCSPELVNDLITGGIDKALTAEQGKELNNKIDNLTTKVNGITPVTVEDYSKGWNNLTSTTNALSAASGKELERLINNVASGGVTVVDNLQTQSSSAALSANMGVKLKGLIDGIETKVSGLSIFGMGYTLEYQSNRVKPQKVIFEDGVIATLTWLGDSVLQKITANTGEVMTFDYDADGRITGRTITRP